MRRTTVLSILLPAGLMAAISVCLAQTPAPAKPSSAAVEKPSTPAAAKASTPAALPQPAWVLRSNQFTQMLLDVQLKHSPESASAQGMASYDPSITDPSRADEIAQHKELADVLDKLNKIEAKEKDRNVREDLEILQQAFNLQFSRDDYHLGHTVQFLDASRAVYVGLHTLLDDKVAADRRPAAVVRLRKYAGVEPGFKPFSDLLKQRMTEQMAKPAVVYPSTAQLEDQLASDKGYIDSIGSLFVKYKLTGWKEPFAKLQQELADYDTWVRTTVMPKARSASRMTSQEYALNLQSYGVDLPPDQLAAQAHAAFTAIQAEMAPLAVAVAKQHAWPLTDYRDVVRELKKKQIDGDAILPFYKARLKEIDDIIVAKNLVTLPDRPVDFRLATATESARTPFPYIVPPPFVNNTGQRGVLVLPMDPAASASGTPSAYDDFTCEASAWPTIAHEAHPGSDLEFDSFLHDGMSDARMLYAYNTANIDSWGLYSEGLMQPYEPVDSQLITLQRRLLHAAQAFLDPELHSGKITTKDATKLLENDVVLSPAYTGEELDRFINRSPGQATSYFYGYTKLHQLRKDTEAALGTKFDAKRFHDFILAQGLLPPDLMRKAVMEDFVPAQKKKK